jgi:hypothetical protein
MSERIPFNPETDILVTDPATGEKVPFPKNKITQLEPQPTPDTTQIIEPNTSKLKTEE